MQTFVYRFVKIVSCLLADPGELENQGLISISH